MAHSAAPDMSARSSQVPRRLDCFRHQSSDSTGARPEKAVPESVTRFGRRQVSPQFLGGDVADE
jgi:hypothetical protein